MTIDATGCRKAIAEQITRQGGDYVPAVKENQPTLHEQIRGPDAAAMHQEYAGIDSGCCEEAGADEVPAGGPVAGVAGLGTGGVPGQPEGVEPEPAGAEKASPEKAGL